MNSQKHKPSVLLVSLASFLTVGSAQISGSGSGLSGGNPLQMFIGFFGSITQGAVDSPPSLVLFLAIIGMFYYMELNLLTAMFNLIKDRVNSGGGSDLSFSTGSGEYPTGVKGLSAMIAIISGVTSFIYVGKAIAWIILGLGIGIIVLAKFFLAQRFMGGGSSAGGGGGSGSSGDPITDGGGPSGEAGEAASELGDIRNQIGDVEQRTGDVNVEIGDAINSGNDEEARDAAKKEETIIKSLNDIETEMEHVFEVEQDDLTTAIDEAKKVIQEEEEEEKDLKNIQERYSRMEQTLEGLYQGCRRAIENGETPLSSSRVQGGASNCYIQKSDMSNYPYNVPAPGMKHIYEDAENSMQQVRRLVDLEENEFNGIRDEFGRLSQEAKNFMNAYEIIQEMKKEIDKLEDEDKKLEKAAEKLGDKELLKMVENEEEQEMKMEQKLQDLMDKEDMIRNELVKAAELVERELEMDTTEIEQINQEAAETDEIENWLKKMQDGVVPEIEYHEDKAHGRRTLNNRIGKMANALTWMKDGLGELEQRKENEIQLLEELESELNQATS